jgi:hypothetical protein
MTKAELHDLVDRLPDHAVDGLPFPETLIAVSPVPT